MFTIEYYKRTVATTSAQWHGVITCDTRAACDELATCLVRQGYITLTFCNDEYYDADTSFQPK